MIVKSSHLIALIFQLSIFCFGLLYFFNLAEVVGSSLFYAVSGFSIIFIFFFFSYFKFRSIINPVSLIIPFALGYFYYGFFISEKQHPLSFETTVAVFLFIFFYILGCCIKLSSKKSFFIPHNVENGFHLSIIIFLIGSVIFFLECFINGGLPLYQVIFLRVDGYSEKKAIPIFHYFVMLHSLMPAIFYFFYKKGKLTRFYFYFLAAFSLFVLFNNLSRQVIILCVLTLFFTFVSVNRFRSDQILLKGAIIMCFVFFGLGYFRVSAINDDISTTAYLKIYSEVPESYDVNLFDVTFNLYSSVNFNTLNDIVSTVEHLDEYGYGKYLFKPVLEISNADFAFDLKYDPRQDSFTRLGTVVADPYLDFGVIGVSFFAFFYGITSAFLYRMFVSYSNLGISVLWSINSFVLLMSVFTNFYNLLFTWICIVLGIYLTGVKFRKKRF